MAIKRTEKRLSYWESMKGKLPKNFYQMRKPFRKGHIGYKAMLGKKHSAETINKLKKSHLGKFPSIETRLKMSETQKRIGNKPPSNKGKIMSEVTKRKISLAHLREKSSFWKGGISKKNELIRRGIDSRLWKNAVFARDNFTCQKCEQRGGDLHPHHIRNFARWILLRFAIDNGITLCIKCHKLFHKIYGFINNDEIQLKEFLCKKNI